MRSKETPGEGCNQPTRGGRHFFAQKTRLEAGLCFYSLLILMMVITS